MTHEVPEFIPAAREMAEDLELPEPFEADQATNKPARADAVA